MLKWILGILGVLFLLVLTAAGVAWWEWRKLNVFAETPFAPDHEVVVEIPPKLGPKAVCQKLADAHVIQDEQLFGEQLFYWDVRFLRREAGHLKAGEYLFQPGQAETPDEIIDRLLKGEVLSAKVTIPEGLRLDEQAPIIEAAGFGKASDFIKLARSPKFTHSLGIEADSLEGYLFPDTYLIPKTSTTEQVIKLMVERFHKAWETADAQRGPDVKLTQHQAVTLASIVEKETGNPIERPRISCVFHNRLHKGMKLQTDPTVIYSIILRTGSFDGNIHKSDLETPHPYNTYSVPGLPPGPIANAGLAALQAALNPITCDDLFFVSKNDGSHVFCPTLACHEANVQKWQVEYFRHKRAGEVPER
jgi:UPF0755 protein